MDWQSIRNYHMSYRINGVVVTEDEFNRRKDSNERGAFETPWRDIGYHVGIELINGKYEAIFGRMPDMHGAHCRELNMNAYGIGILCTGNYDLAPPAPGMINKLIEVCAYFMVLYRIPPMNVIGHGEAQIADPSVGRALKSCPGKYFDMTGLRRRLAQMDIV